LNRTNKTKEIMSEQELYKDEQRSIMIQECNAIMRGLMSCPSYQNPNIIRVEHVTIYLN